MNHWGYLMYKLLWSILISILIVVVFPSSAHSQTNVYYVNPGGNDLNPGNMSAPFKTLSKAVSVLTPGSSLNVSGRFNETFTINKSGTASSRIKIIGNNAVIDTTGLFGIAISGSYIDITGFEITNVLSHGFHTTGTHITANNISVHDSVRENQGRLPGGRWGSAFSIKLGSDDILLTNIKSYRNYGEGMAITRAKNVTVRDSIFYDNYSSTGPYIDNSINVLVDKNFSYCTLNSGFERSGAPGYGVLIGEESYSGWGSQLNGVKIINNIVSGCRGMGFWGSTVGGGLRNALIAFNTINGVRGSVSAIPIAQASANTNIRIVNNIALGAISLVNGVSSTNNLTANPGYLTDPGIDPTGFKLSQSSSAFGGAIDVGINYDFAGNPRGPRFDIGAWQFESQIIAKNGDVNGDGKVNIIDIGIIIDNYGKIPILVKMADINNDGKVNIVDIGIAIDNYSK